MPAKAKLTTRERTTSNVAADNLNKGSELSFAEADSNFFNLRDQSFAISDGTTSTDIEAGETITFSGASVSGNTVSITGGASLGDLTATGSTLQSPSNADLTLQASGTGNIVADGYNGLKITQNSSPTQFGEITTTGDFGIRLSTNNFNTAASRILIGSVGDGRNITISSPSGKIYLQGGGTEMGANLDMDGNSIISNSNQNIPITPNGTGKIILDGLNWPTADGTNGQFLITDGAGNLSFSSTSLTTFGDLTAVGSTITAPSNADLTLATSGSGDLVSSGNHRITGDLEVDVIRPEAAGNDIHILGLDVDVTNRSYVKVEGGAQAGVWIKGAAEISFDTSDTIGSGNSLHIGELFTRFNKGGNDTQNIMFHANQYPNNTHGLLHIETYADRGTTNGVGMVTINDSDIAYNWSSAKFEGQGTEVFNVFGTARLDNVFFKDNKIYTNQSNEDLELECSGTGTIDLKLPTSTTIGSNGGASALTANPVGYVKVKINGTEYQIPYYNV